MLHIGRLDAILIEQARLKRAVEDASGVDYKLKRMLEERALIQDILAGKILPDEFIDPTLLQDHPLRDDLYEIACKIDDASYYAYLNGPNGDALYDPKNLLRLYPELEKK